MMNMLFFDVVDCKLTFPVLKTLFSQLGACRSLGMWECILSGMQSTRFVHFTSSSDFPIENLISKEEHMLLIRELLTQQAIYMAKHPGSNFVLENVSKC